MAVVQLGGRVGSAVLFLCLSKMFVNSNCGWRHTISVICAIFLILDFALTPYTPARRVSHCMKVGPKVCPHVLTLSRNHHFFSVWCFESLHRHNLRWTWQSSSEFGTETKFFRGTVMLPLALNLKWWLCHGSSLCLVSQTHALWLWVRAARPKRKCLKITSVANQEHWVHNILPNCGVPFSSIHDYVNSAVDMSSVLMIYRKA